MKKIIFVLLVIALIIVGYTHDQFVWCKKLLFGEPTTHIIQKGEYLSTIAQKYYGNSGYWRELALVNRAPNSNLIYPGEEIIIPSLNAVKEIRRTSWLSKVNSYVKNEEDIIARLSRGEETNLAANEPKTTPEQLLDTKANESNPVSVPVANQAEISQQSIRPAAAVTQSRESSSTIVLGAVAVLLLASVVALILIRQKKRSQQITIVDDDELNLIGSDEESEPDYKNYLRKRSRRKKDALVG